MKGPTIVSASIAVVALAAPLAAYAQGAANYPAKVVRVVIAWPAGGSNDLAGRVLTQKLSQNLGQQFVVDNRGGAAGTIGADLAAKAPPDGYTLLVHSTTHVSNPWLYKNLPYDTFKDFAPVSTIASQPSALCVHPSLPVKTVKDFIALAKARPGQLNYGSSGNGSLPHLSMALLEDMAKVKLTHVPYKGGAASVTSVLSGETQLLFGTVSSMMTHIQSQKLRAIGVSSSKRLKALPNVPTVAESGLPGYEMDAWIGVFAPGATPRDIVEKLNREITRALQSPDVEKALVAQGGEPWIMTPDQFAKRLRQDYEKYGRLIKLTGAKVE